MQTSNNASINCGIAAVPAIIEEKPDCMCARRFRRGHVCSLNCCRMCFDVVLIRLHHQTSVLGARCSVHYVGITKCQCYQYFVTKHDLIYPSSLTMPGFKFHGTNATGKSPMPNALLWQRFQNTHSNIRNPQGVRGPLLFWNTQNRFIHRWAASGTRSVINFWRYQSGVDFIGSILAEDIGVSPSQKLTRILLYLGSNIAPGNAPWLLSGALRTYALYG